MKTYRGMLVQDATSSLRVTLSLRNVTEAIPRDPENCAFALCIKQTLGVSTVIIFKTTAYIEKKVGKGSVLERYTPNQKAKYFISKFDDEEISGVPIQVVFEFYPPSASRKLGYEKELFETTIEPTETIKSKVEFVKPKESRKPYIANRGRIKFD